VEGGFKWCGSPFNALFSTESPHRTKRKYLMRLFVPISRMTG
jgi:hypothetical protein